MKRKKLAGSTGSLYGIIPSKQKVERDDRKHSDNSMNCLDDAITDNHGYIVEKRLSK